MAAGRRRFGRRALRAPTPEATPIMMMIALFVAKKPCKPAPEKSRVGLQGHCCWLIALDAFGVAKWVAASESSRPLSQQMGLDRHLAQAKQTQMVCMHIDRGTWAGANFKHCPPRLSVVLF